MTFQRARWTFITPEIAAAVAPAVPPAAPAFVPPQSCNPITNAPCTNGQACDFGPSRTGFACYPVGSASLCEPCNPRTGPHCAQGHLCVLRDDNDPASGQCLRTCCNQDDCGGPRVGRCERSGRGSVGMCAMLNEVMFSPLCAGIPAVQPSGGMCGG